MVLILFGAGQNAAKRQVIPVRADFLADVNFHRMVRFPQHKHRDEQL